MGDRVLELGGRVRRERLRRGDDDKGRCEAQAVAGQREEDVLRTCWERQGRRREQDEDRRGLSGADDGRVDRRPVDVERVAGRVRDGPSASSTEGVKGGSAKVGVSAGCTMARQETYMTISSLLRDTTTSRMHHCSPSRAASVTNSNVQRTSRMPSVKLRAASRRAKQGQRSYMWPVVVRAAGGLSRDARRPRRKKGLRAIGGASTWASWM